MELPFSGKFYHNAVLQLTQWQHPKITYLLALSRTFQAKDK